MTYKNKVNIINKKDKQGNIIEESYYNKENLLIENKEGIAIYRWKYNYYGNRMEENQFGQDEKLKTTIIWKYNFNGNKIEQTTYGPDKKLKEINGIAIIQWKYNDQKKIIEWKNIGKNEDFKKISPAIFKYRYDNDNYIKKITTYNSNENIIEIKYIKNLYKTKYTNFTINKKI